MALPNLLSPWTRVAFGRVPACNTWQITARLICTALWERAMHPLLGLGRRCANPLWQLGRSDAICLISLCFDLFRFEAKHGVQGGHREATEAYQVQSFQQNTLVMTKPQSLKGSGKTLHHKRLLEDLGAAYISRRQTSRTQGPLPELSRFTGRSPEEATDHGPSYPATAAE